MKLTRIVSQKTVNMTFTPEYCLRRRTSYPKGVLMDMIYAWINLSGPSGSFLDLFLWPPMTANLQA